MSTGGINRPGLQRTTRSLDITTEYRNAQVGNQPQQRVPPPTLQRMNRSTNLPRVAAQGVQHQAAVIPAQNDKIQAESLVTSSKAWNLKSLFLQSGQRLIGELKADPHLTPQQHTALDALETNWQQDLAHAQTQVNDPANRQAPLHRESDMEAICPKDMPKMLYRQVADALGVNKSELADSFRDAFIRTTNDQVPWVTIQSDIKIGNGPRCTSTLTPVNSEFDADNFGHYGNTGLSSNAPRLSAFDQARFEGSRATNLWNTKYTADDGSVLFSAFRSGCLGAKGSTLVEKATCAKQNSMEVLTAMVVQKLKDGATQPVDLKVCSINLQSGGAIGGEGEMILYQRLGLESAANTIGQNGVTIKQNGVDVTIPVNVTMIQARAASNHVGFNGGPAQKAANAEVFNHLRAEINSRANISPKAQALWEAVQKTGKSSTGGFKLASRLALLAHELGYQVHFNCMSGKDRTGLMDVECKVLAHRLHANAAADPNNVEVPFGLKTDEDRDLFNKLLFEGGSQKVTQHNTGIQAYKVDPAWVFEEPLTGLYSRLGGTEKARDAVLGGIRYTMIDKW